MRETVQSFCVTNEEFSAKSSHSKDVEVCELACEVSVLYWSSMDVVLVFDLSRTLELQSGKWSNVEVD